MNMKTSVKGRVALAVSEGIVDRPYLDSVGVWTIGIGHTASAGLPIPKENIGHTYSVEQILNIFERDLAKFERRVNRLVKVPLKQHEFDALVHFDFNTGGLGKSALLRNLNAGKKELAFEKGFHGWIKPASLIGRRDKERKMAQHGDYGPTIAPFYATNVKGKPVSRGTIDIAKHLTPTKPDEVVLTTIQKEELPAEPTKHTEVIAVAGPKADETTVVVVPHPVNVPAKPTVPQKKTGLMVLAALVASLLTYVAKYFGG